MVQRLGNGGGVGAVAASWNHEGAEGGRGCRFSLAISKLCYKIQFGTFYVRTTILANNRKSWIQVSELDTMSRITFCA